MKSKTGFKIVVSFLKYMRFSPIENAALNRDISCNPSKGVKSY